MFTAADLDCVKSRRACAICFLEKDAFEFKDMRAHGCSCTTPFCCASCILEWAQQNGGKMEKWVCPCCRNAVSLKREISDSRGESVDQRRPFSEISDALRPFIGADFGRLIRQTLSALNDESRASEILETVPNNATRVSAPADHVWGTGYYNTHEFFSDVFQNPMFYGLPSVNITNRCRRCGSYAEAPNVVKFGMSLDQYVKLFRGDVPSLMRDALLADPNATATWTWHSYRCS